ncbi:Epoxyqueuosine reductase [Flavobacteriales bacterium]|nr:Epoxyqueuosine reductase [Flavobacteriales bacterium]MCL4815386.1 tRNA epoxyqueuosine(34) reductase QueG [Flavobacteriales bacterium]WKZ75005.1 MAG: tRNA epoxyqueuosine(34) reductase QueG [Vicingaceae bacterium]GIK69947.1 MAG: epoxyqueuosine reductase [Bacteroidota bacterium]CAG0959932.1 Epoxyqueuosine reductase [Flavobacteriales bacterium]
MNKSISERTHILKELAKELGFECCGISAVGYLKEEAPRMKTWLQEGKHGKMQYLENYFEKRMNPSLLVEGAVSVISLLYNYYSTEKQPAEAPRISMYAWGNDYHKVIKDKLFLLLEIFQQQTGKINARVFTDSAPVMERVWAAKSGLGWIGKHTLLINKNKGSYFFIAEIICDAKFEYDTPIENYCGTCTQCIDACPTHAIEPFSVDASKCISYATIELKDEKIPPLFENKIQENMFGCDICQQVCPWNRFAQPHNEPLFEMLEPIKKWKMKEWTEMNKEFFNKKFKNSPLLRTKHSGIERNLKFILKSK